MYGFLLALMAIVMSFHISSNNYADRFDFNYGMSGILNSDVVSHRDGEFGTINYTLLNSQIGKKQLFQFKIYNSLNPLHPVSTFSFDMYRTPFVQHPFTRKHNCSDIYIALYCRESFRNENSWNYRGYEPMQSVSINIHCPVTSTVSVELQCRGEGNSSGRTNPSLLLPLLFKISF
jgi:hypothetical protein